MNEFLVLSLPLIVSILAFNAFCMNPSNWSPPPPKDVVFGECFFVPEITGVGLSDEIFYSYRHICRQKFPQDGPQPPRHERNWYFVGTLRSVETPPYYNYVPIEQSLIQFTFLNQLEVKFVLRFTNREFKITFQSVQQRQAFYGLIYHDVILRKAATHKIGVLHEVPIHEDGTIGNNTKIGNNIEAFCEQINDLWHITLKNEQGEPVLIFSQTEAFITRMKFSQCNMEQLLLKAHGTFYILTFSSHTEAKHFSEALLTFLKILHIKNISHNLEAHYKYKNKITINS